MAVVSDYAYWTIVVRLTERATLAVVIITVCLIAIVAFWRSVQRIDFEVAKSKEIGFSANVLLATPIFIVLVLVGYAFVSFSHPISLSLGRDGNEAWSGATGPVSANNAEEFSKETPVALDAMRAFYRSRQSSITDEVERAQLLRADAIVRNHITQLVDRVYGAGSYELYARVTEQRERGVPLNAQQLSEVDRRRFLAVERLFAQGLGQ